jgi:galactosylceramidase
MNRRARNLSKFLSLLLLILCGGCIYSQQTTVILDGHSGGRVFDGLGAASAGASSRLLIDYPEPQRSEILDYLFKPDYGASLQHLKVEVGADVNSTDGSEPSHMRTPGDHDSTRGYEWWLMSEAHKRNPNIVLEILPWGAPGWVGDPTAAKPTLYTKKMAAYVVDFIRTAKRDYGLDISYAGPWNEKVHDVGYIKELHRQFEGAHLDTKIICCDEYPGQGSGQWSIADEMLKDPELASAISVIGVHYPLVNGAITTTSAARDTGRPLWSSEDQPNSGGGPFVSRNWDQGGRILAHLYNKNYLEGSLTSTEIWSPITSYYDILAAPNSGLMYANTPWSGHYDVQGAIWTTAHTTQFAQPGWQYLDSASGNLPDKGSYVSLRAQDGKNWSVILESIGAAHAQTVTFQIAGGLMGSTVHIWETNSGRTFEHVADIKPVNGEFSYTFDADSLYSLTSTSGQHKGTAQPPTDAPFPLPYADNFEDTPLHHTPKYLSDQDGAFEIQRCEGRPGNCLEQMIAESPIPWGPLPNPFSLAGDESWKDYSVSADVHFLSQASAALIGRIDSSDVFSDGRAKWPAGYVLQLQPDGSWELLSTEYKKAEVTLASGKVTIDRARWHHMELRFHGTRIETNLDGSPLAAVENAVHGHGMFALGTDWNRIEFDNLRVTP